MTDSRHNPERSLLESLSPGAQHRLREMGVVLDSQLRELSLDDLHLPSADLALIHRFLREHGGEPTRVDVTDWCGVPLDEKQRDGREGGS